MSWHGRSADLTSHSIVASQPFPIHTSKDDKDWAEQHEEFKRQQDEATRERRVRKPSCYYYYLTMIDCCYYV